MTNFTNKLDGLLLSDGSIIKSTQHHIHKDDTQRYRYVQGCIHLEWLEDVGDWLLDEGSFRSGISLRKKSRWLKYQAYILYSQHSLFFEEQRNRWYEEYYFEGEGKFKATKIVPKDIDLTPECVANWFMGDGFISKRKFENSYLIGLCTNSFTKEHVEYLNYLLNEQVTDGFYLSKAGIKKSGEQAYIINLSKRLKVKEFLEYISTYIITCFDYKIPEVN